MEKRTFGNTDMELSVLGFGGSEIGFQGVPEERVGSILNEALDAGLNIIDTAECYMGGEELIGKAVSGRRGADWVGFSLRLGSAVYCAMTLAAYCDLDGRARA